MILSRISWLLCGFVLAGLLSFSRSATADSKIITLTLHWGFQAEATDPMAKAEVAVFEEFRHLHPNYRFRKFQSLRLPESDAMDFGALMAMAGGVGPDVLYVNFRNSETFISQGFLVPLDDYINKDPAKDKIMSAIPKPALPVVRRKGPDGKDHIWCLPYFAIARPLVIRKERLTACGLDPRHPPDNWEEFFQMGMRMTDPERGYYAYYKGNTQDQSFIYAPFLWSSGADFVDQDKAGNWKAAFDSDKAIDAAMFWWRLLRSPWTRCLKDNTPCEFKNDAKTAKCPQCGATLDRDEAEKNNKLYRGICDTSANPYDALNRGKIAFSFMYFYDTTLAQIDPNVWMVADVPAGPRGDRRSELNCGMFGINDTVKDPAVRQAAWEYVKYYGSEDAIRIRCRVLVENGWAKFINPKWLIKFGYKDYIREVPKGWAEIYERSLENGRPEPYGKNCQFIYHEASAPLEEAQLMDYVTRDQMREILKEQAKSTNDKILGFISPDEQRRRTHITLVAVILMAVAMAYLYRISFRSAMAGMSSGSAGQKSDYETGKGRHSLILATLFLFPAVASVALWAYYPLVKGSLMAFQDYRLILPSHWTGVGNFSRAFFSPDFWKALYHSFQYCVLSLLLGFATPIALALLLHEVPRGKILFRTIYYLPAVTTGVVIFVLWRLLYDPSPMGVFNQMLGLLHVKPQSFTNDPQLAMLCCIIPTIWAGVGPGCIIYLAALRAIPEELYQAAELDGSGFWGKFAMITVPYLKALIIINFVGAFIGGFKSFDTIFILTGGGPVGATNVLGLEIWYNAYLYLKYGYAVAMAWILGSLLIGFTVTQLRILSRLEFRTASAQE